MALLIDTHALVWAIGARDRLPDKVVSRLDAADEQLFVSGVTAWEYADLHRRGRLPAAAEFGIVMAALSITLLDTPADLWRRLAAMLPNLHRDPVDRMLIAHAIHADLTLVTADETMRRYPVRCLW